MTHSLTPLALGDRRHADDQGIAMITVVIMLAMLTGIGVTSFALATNNLRNAKADRVSATALSNAEAGVGQAVAYLRRSGTGGLKCSPNCGVANPWGEEPAEIDGDAAPSTVVTYNATEAYSVWFTRLQEPDIPARKPGVYRINSIGTSRDGKRQTRVVVRVAPFEFPLAVYADGVEAGGNGAIQTESLITKGCLYRRGNVKFSGVDPVNNIPAAAHSAQYITDTNGSGPTCPSSDSKNIHKGGPCNGTATSSTVAGYPFDQDRQGGDLTGTPCLRKGPVRYPGSDPDYATTSKIVDADDLAKKFRFNLEGLTAEQLDQLRTAAREQGFYTTSDPSIPSVLQAANAVTTYPNPVLFYDFQGAANIGKLVDLKQFSDSYGRATPLEATDAACTPAGVIVVVVNGDIRLNAGQTLVGSVFAMGGAPGTGRVNKANGNSRLIGTLYARSLDLTGTADINLDRCFLQNLPGQLLGVTTDTFAEVDR